MLSELGGHDLGSCSRVRTPGRTRERFGVWDHSVRPRRN